MPLPPRQVGAEARAYEPEVVSNICCLYRNHRPGWVKLDDGVYWPDALVTLFNAAVRARGGTQTLAHETAAYYFALSARHRAGSAVLVPELFGVSLRLEFAHEWVRTSHYNRQYGESRAEEALWQANVHDVMAGAGSAALDPRPAAWR